MNHSSVAYVIALYIRLSSEDSKVGSFSIENQKRALHRYVESMEETADIEVLEFVDNGYSGTNFERPAVQELMNLVRAGKINCIIVKDFSRLGRNSIEVGYFMERVFPVYGIRFISINDDFDSNRLHGDTGGLGAAFKYLVAEFYSRDLSVKYKTAKYTKMKRGEYQSKLCPYGYQKGMDGRMEIDKEAAENVRLIFELANRGHSASQICKELFQRGIPTPGEYKASRGMAYYNIARCHGIWDKSRILRMLADERYAGTYIMGKRRVTEVGSNHVRMRDESEWFKIPDHHPGIISMELYKQVQARLLHFQSKKQNNSQYPLKKKVFCGNCRHALIRNSAQSHSFFCRHSRVDESAPCHGLSIRESELEDVLYQLISKQAQIILNMDTLADGKAMDVSLAEVTEYSKQIENGKSMKRSLYEQLLCHEITLDEYKTRKAEIDKKLERLEQMAASLKRQAEQMRMDEEIKNTRQDLAQAAASADRLTTELADALIERVYLYPDHQIEVVWKVKDFFMEGLDEEDNTYKLI